MCIRDRLLYGALTSGSAMRVAALAALWLVYAYWMVAGDRRNMVEYNRIYFCNQVSMQTHYIRCALGLKLPAYDEKYRQGMLIELIDSGIDSVMMRFQDFFSMLVKGVSVLAICALIGIAGSLRLSVAFFALAGAQILLCALIDRRMKDVSRKLTDLQAAYTGGVQALFASYESYTCAGLHGLWFDKIARISDERVREKRRMEHLTALQAFVCGMMSIVTYGAILAFALSNSGDVVALMALPIGYQALNDALTDFVRALSSIRSESHLADRLDAVSYTHLDVYKRQAFEGCHSLRSVKLPDMLTAIGDWAFSGCRSLSSVKLPDTLMAIGDRAFYGCSSLHSVEFARECGVTTIGYMAFFGCSSLRSVKLPDKLTAIGDMAFSNCHSLRSINLPDSLTTLGEAVFGGTSSMKRFEVSANHPTLKVMEGVLYKMCIRDSLQAAVCTGAMSCRCICGLLLSSRLQ